MYRRFLRWLLFRNWRASLSFGDRLRLDYWGATGNPDHHPFAWADNIPKNEKKTLRKAARRKLGALAGVKADPIKGFTPAR